MYNDRTNAIRGKVVSLEIQFFDTNNNPIDADSIPKIRIIDSTGNVILNYTNKKVFRKDKGLYEYLYEVPSDGAVGTWVDEWESIIGGQTINTIFIFNVISAEDAIEPTTGPGKVKIGDDVNFDFSPEEILGINILLKYLKVRLNSSGVKPLRDDFGKILRGPDGEALTVECNVFDDEVLIVFLCQALSEFNMIPFFTAYTFADQIIQTLFAQAIVEGAYISSLATQSITEKGRDFTISDGGINYNPPQLGDFLQSHYTTWLNSYRERLKFIKNSIRPGPQGFGTYSTFGARSPAIMRQRHLRSRRLY
jgi:hypothetical protein